jgi:hypothetical protein
MATFQEIGGVEAEPVKPYTLVPLGWDKEGRGHLGSFYTLLTETLCKTREVVMEP